MDDTTTTSEPTTTPINGKPAFPVERRVLSFRERILDLGLAVTALGLLSYCLARFLVDGYLATFHLSFDEVGLDYGKLVASGALFTIPSVLLMLLTYRVFDAAWSRLAPRLQKARSDALRLITFLLVYTVGIAILIGIYLLAGRYLRLIPLPDQDRETFGGIAGVVLLAALSSAIAALLFDSGSVLGSYWSRAIRNIRATPTDPPPRRGRVAVAMAASAMLFIVFCVAAYLFGAWLAKPVERGERQNVTVLGLRMPGLAAKPVKVVVPGGVPGAGQVPTDRCLLLIGERGETVLLYDYRDEKIYRVSTQTVYTVESIEAQSVRDGRC